MDRWLGARAWAITVVLVAGVLLAAAVVVRTGGSASLVTVGLVSLAAISVAAARSGGTYAFEDERARPVGVHELPSVRRALLEVTERSGRRLPRLVVVEMDAPGAVVGYDAGTPVVAVDPLLPRIVGPDGVRALLAHELGHLGTDLTSDAVRAYAPQAIGFGAYWLVFLAGRGPLLASAGTVLYVGLATHEHPAARATRAALSLASDPAALAASRYANRLEEYRADAFAATVVDPWTLAEALFRVAAVATGDDVEDVAGPVPWSADRSLVFALFATHPSVEDRVRRLGCSILDWVTPYRPDR
ncbi:MAG: M48 family metallopeptidase [Halanaeroarchaeum sp.]